MKHFKPRPLSLVVLWIVLWSSRMWLLGAWYERAEEVHYYPPEADSVAIGLVGDLMITLFAIPFFLMALWLSLRRCPRDVSWLAWSRIRFGWSIFWTLFITIISWFQISTMVEEFRLNLPLNALSSILWIFLLMGLRAVIVSKLDNRADASEVIFSKRVKAISVAGGFVLLLVGLFFFFKGEKWEGYVFTSKINAEGNYVSTGVFKSEDACKAASRSAVKNKRTITLSNYASDRPKVVDAYLCGRSCKFPDGPRDVSISELKCVEDVREVTYPEGVFFDELTNKTESQSFFPEGRWQLQSSKCSNDQWESQKAKKENAVTDRQKTEYVFSGSELVQITRYFEKNKSTPFCEYISKSIITKEEDGKGLVIRETEVNTKPVSKRCQKQLPRGGRGFQFVKQDPKLLMIFSEESSPSCKTHAQKIYVLERSR